MRTEETVPRTQEDAGSGVEPSEDGYDRMSTLIAVSDLHGFLDGVTAHVDGPAGAAGPTSSTSPYGKPPESLPVGGMDGILPVVEYYDSLKGTFYKNEELYVFVVGDMVAPYRHRCLWDGTAKQCWLAILDSIGPRLYGVTFGNHELHFEDIVAEERDDIHCHNLRPRPGGVQCFRCDPAVNVSPNATCRRSRGSADPRFCGVTHVGGNTDMMRCGRTDEELAAYAEECITRCTEYSGERCLRVLLAHYSDHAPAEFRPTAPRGYDVVLKAHDHRPGAAGSAGDLPIVVETDVNGRSAAVLRLWWKEHEIIHAKLLLHPLPPTSVDPWSVRSELPDVATGEEVKCVWDRGYLPRFGGQTDKVPEELDERWRAARLGLCGMQSAYATGDKANHLFMVAATAIRDDVLVPAPGRPYAIDTWDLKAVYGSEDNLVTFEVPLSRLEDGLHKALQTRLLEPWSYTDVQRILLASEHRHYCVTRAGGELSAQLLSGERCAFGAPSPLRSALVLPASACDPTFTVTMPSFMARKVFRAVCGWGDLELSPGKHKELRHARTRGLVWWQTIGDFLDVHADKAIAWAWG